MVRTVGKPGRPCNPNSGKTHEVERGHIRVLKGMFTFLSATSHAALLLRRFAHLAQAA